MTKKELLKSELVLTKKNIIELKEELRNLVQFKRKEVIDELKQARSQGDLSENSEYDAAKQKQTEIENRIQQITEILKKAHLTYNSKKKVVTIGKTVRFLDIKTKKEMFVKIGTVSDINVENNVISNFSPLAKSLMNHKVGDQVTINNSNNRFYQIKILTIE